MAKMLNRRQFLKCAIITAGSGAAITALYVHKNSRDILSIQWQLNRAYRIKEKSLKIRIFTYLASGEEVYHNIEGFESDLLLLVNDKKIIKQHIAELSSKYNLSITTCTDKAKRFIEEYENACIIYNGPEMKAKKVEFIYEKIA